VDISFEQDKNGKGRRLQIRSKQQAKQSLANNYVSVTPGLEKINTYFEDYEKSYYKK
jgi:hypothetical protein